MKAKETAVAPIEHMFHKWHSNMMKVSAPTPAATPKLPPKKVRDHDELDLWGKALVMKVARWGTVSPGNRLSRLQDEV